jgi:hypothetical protein
MKRQVGLFFLLLGLLGVILFCATFLSDTTIWLLGFFSFAMIAFGVWILVRSQPPPPPDERFRYYRRLRSDRNKKKKRK